MRHLDLFSGIGGFALASTWVWGDEYQNVGHSEVDDYACKVYHRHFPESKCLGDITKIKWEEGQADLITGGFPCQPHSVAGKRKASADERDLWGECVRAIRGVRPRYAVFENVPGLLVSERGRFFNRVITDLAESGYDVEYRILSAQSVGAPHKRDRVWIVAHSKGVDARREAGELRQTERGQGGTLYGESGRASGATDVDHPQRPGRSGSPGDTQTEQGSDRPEDGLPESPGDVADTNDPQTTRQRQYGGQIHPKPEAEGLDLGSCDENVANGNIGRCEECGEQQFSAVQSSQGCCHRGAEQWSVEPNVGRVAHGIPSRVDRLKGLGNSIVPQVAYQILMALK